MHHAQGGVGHENRVELSGAGVVSLIAVLLWQGMDSKILGRRQFRHVTILQDYHRFRHLENIVLWDTPELHLNAALEARLYDAISRIAPKNHY